ncbi:MAG: ExbD/TolR family protein [Flavobacterium sp.]|jgi:biopolymer transport protein ExbD
MSKFVKKKDSGDVPAISTASLPDIVFMLLFFFMVSTTLRDTDLMLDNALPKADQTNKLDKKERVFSIFIGKPHPKYKLGSGESLQLDDKISTVNDIPDFIKRERAKRDPSLEQALVAALKVDKNSKMGLVSEVKKKLRESAQYKVNYVTNKGSVVD